jgi:hypothetical protein
MEENNMSFCECRFARFLLPFFFCPGSKERNKSQRNPLLLTQALSYFRPGRGLKIKATTERAGGARTRDRVD